MSPNDSEELPPGVRNLSPTAKLAYKTLRYEEPLTQQELIKEAYNPHQRTVQRALKALEKDGYIYKEAHMQDGRKDLYYIAQG